MMFEDILKRFSKEHAFLTKEKLYSIYEKVADDIEQGFKDKGVWTKAFADSGGDQQKQKAIYIELMVERIVLAEAVLLEKGKKTQKVKGETQPSDNQKISPEAEETEKKAREEARLAAEQKKLRTEENSILEKVIFSIPLIFFLLGIFIFILAFAQ